VLFVTKQPIALKDVLEMVLIGAFVLLPTLEKLERSPNPFLQNRLLPPLRVALGDRPCQRIPPMECHLFSRKVFDPLKAVFHHGGVKGWIIFEALKCSHNFRHSAHLNKVQIRLTDGLVGGFGAKDGWTSG
jgi:hypothetical protein